MNVEALDESWCIVLVATSQNAHQLPQTLEDVQARSLSSRISVLAAENATVRGALCGLPLHVSYALPSTIESGSYWATVLSAYKCQRSRTIFLLAGARVPEHWDARLVAAGQRATHAVAIAPLCVRHPILSAFTSSDYIPRLAVEEVDQWLNDYATGNEFTVPVMLESCLMLQGDYWTQENLRFSSDQELLDSLRLHGKIVLATDQVYIDDAQTNYSRDVSFLPAASLTAYTQRHPLADVRHALVELSSRAERPAEMRHCLPVVLHVGHSWGGGLSRWIENFIASDRSHNHLVLRSIGDRSAFGQQIALYPGAEMRVPLRTWILPEPIQSIVKTQYEYELLIQEVIDEFGVESLIISSLIGHSMDVLRSGLPAIFVMHDFFPFCPALYATFGNPCHSCNQDDLAECGKLNPLHSYFKLESDKHWLEARATFLELIMDHRISLVSPSYSVVNRYVALDESLRKKGIQVIEHGLSHDLVESLSLARNVDHRNTSSRLKIVILGRMTREKGSAILLHIIGAVVKFADVWLLGAGENGQQFIGKPNVTIIEEYAVSDLHVHLQSISPHIGMLLSIVPETFSYTLSELWAAGIPVLATRLGAFSDRIIEGENGWLESPNADRILERLVQINDDRDALALVREHLMQQSIRSATEMAKEYQLLQADRIPAPIKRYFLPRKTYRNPYRKHGDQAPNTALYIDHQATYRAVLREFLQYSAQKIERTSRLSTGSRSICKRIIDTLLVLLSPQKTKK